MQNANRVAINTIIQYIQLILNVVIGLYSVRIILNALGHDDYGIYDVVAGIIAVLSFIKSSMSQTSIRYLAVSLGTKDIEEIRSTFNKCFWLHLFISIGLVILMEIVGQFLFDGFLNIDINRIRAAKIVFHCMIVTLFLNIAITPFSALIIAHEKFVYFSFIGILDSLLKLAIAIVLLHTSQDKLIVYAVLMVGVSIINKILHITYLLQFYRKEMYIGKVVLSEYKDITGFAGWTFLDVMGAVASRQGYAIMLNKFFGTTVNAAFAVSRQVEGHTYTISSSVINTMKPQIMKSYGAGDIKRMLRLAMTSGKFGFSMMALAAIPLIIMMPLILELWLIRIPEGAIGFARLLVIATLIDQLTKGIVHACQATGNIKWFSIFVSMSRFAALPISIVFLSFQFPAITALYVYVACETMGSLLRVFIMSYLTAFQISDFMKSVVLRILPPFILAYTTCYFTYQAMGPNISSMAVSIVATGIVYGLLTYIIGLEPEEKMALINILNSAKARLSKI